jgi:DNA-binding XRE family transcriptional regulator
MSTWATLTPATLVQTPTPADFATSGASIDIWIGSRVRVRRASHGMTRQDLCRLLGIDCHTFAAHEAGEERINARLLLRIAKLLEVQPDYFFRGYPEEDRETP